MLLVEWNKMGLAVLYERNRQPSSPLGSLVQDLKTTRTTEHTMGFQPVPDPLSVEFVFWNGTTYAENVLHHKTSASITAAGMLTFAADLRAWYVANVKERQPATLFLSKIIIKDLTTQNAPGIEYTAGMPLPGDRNAPILPMNVTAAVKLLTGLRGRSYRGRLYYVGLCESDVTGDKVNGDVVVDILGRYETLLAVKYAPNDGDWVVVSRWSGLAPRPAGVTTVITGFGMDEVIDSQRRRLLGRGQ